MKHYCCIFFFSVITIGCLGQYNSYQTDYNFSNRSNGVIASLTPAPKEKITDVYLYPEFNIADIYFKDSTKVSDVSVKFDLTHNVIDVRYNEDIRVLPLSQVLAVTLKKTNGENEIYVNGRTALKSSTQNKEQLLEVLNQDSVSLYSKSVVTIIEASTNPALGLTKEPEVVIKKKYIITYKQKLIEIENKSKLKTDLIEIFGEDVAPHVKKVNVKSEVDLVLLTKHLSTLKKY